MSGAQSEDLSATGSEPGIGESASNTTVGSCGCFNVGLPLLVTLAGAIIGGRLGAGHGWMWTIAGALAGAVASALLSVVAVTLLAWIILRIVARRPASPAP